MLTQAQHQDIANTVEMRIITALGADTWLKVGGTGGIKKIAAKAVDMRGRAWWKNVLPCLVVSAYRVTDEPERATLGAHAILVGCRVEYLNMAGDLAAGRDAAQTVGTRLARWLKDEQTNGAKRINLLLNDGDGVVRGSRVNVFDERDEEGDGFWIQVVFEFEIGMRAAQ